MNQEKLTLKNLALSTLGFCAFVVFMFRKFLFDASTLMNSSDQLNGLGYKWFREDSWFISQWNDHILGGMPSVDAMFGDVYHPLSIFYLMFDIARAFGHKQIAYVIIAFICGMFLFSYLTKNWKSGLVVSALFALNPFFFSHIYPGHEGKMAVIAVAPLCVYGLLKFSRENKIWGIPVMGVSIGWMLMSSHVQMTYFFLWGLFFISIYEIFIHNKNELKLKLGKQSLIGVAVIIGILLGAVQLIPPYKYSTEQSVRATEEKTTIDHAISWSLHQEEAASLILPDFLGIDTGKKAYWGHNAFKLNHETAGILLTILAFIGLFTKERRKEKFFWLLMATLSLTFAVGGHTPLFQIFYSIVPGVKLFRGPSMAMIWWSFSLAMLAALYLKEFDSKNRAHKIGIYSFAGVVVALAVTRFMWISAISGMGFVLILGATAALYYGLAKQYSPEKPHIKHIPNWIKVCTLIPVIVLFFISMSGQDHLSGQYFKKINETLMNSSASDMFTSIAIALAILGALLYTLTSKIKTNQFIAMLLVLGAIDTLAVNNQFISTVPKNRYVANNQIVDALKKQIDSKNQHRILSLGNLINEGMLPYYNIQSPAGYHDNEIAAYRTFRGGKQMDNLLYKLRQNEIKTNPYLNILGIKFLVLPGQNGPQILQNTQAFNKTTLFYDYTIIDTTLTPELFESGKFDYSQTVVLEKEPTLTSFTKQDSTRANALGTSIITDYTMDDFTIAVETEKAALLFINDNYHEYWNAEINGKKVPIIKAFNTFRAVEVPAGKSTVRMYYKSEMVSLSAMLVYIGIAITALFFALPLIIRKKTSAA